MTTATIISQSQSPHVQKRVALAEQLLSRLNSPSEAKIEPLWLQEAAYRAAEIDKGLSQRVPAEEVRQQANALLK